VDIILRIVPPMGDELILSDNRQLIYSLTQHGYSISKVSLDQYQSSDFLQILERKGYGTELVSVDITMDPYENLKTALYEGRVLVYDYPPLMEELRTLQKDLIKRKIDHPPRGSKDLCDSLAGTLFTLADHSYDEPMPMVRSGFDDEEIWIPEPINSRDPLSPGTPQSILPPFLVGGHNDWDDGPGW
jgi:hypothetical protein